MQGQVLAALQMQADPVELEQLRRFDWQTNACQVGRCSARHAVDLPEGLRNPLRILQFISDGNHHIVPFLQRIRITLRQGQLEHHVRVPLAIACNQRRDQHTKAIHAMYPQAPAGLLMGAASFLCRFLHILEYLPAALQEALTGLSQTEPAGGAL